MSQLDHNIAALPEMSYSVLLTTGETVLIKRGENGYFETGYGAQGEEVVAKLNERMGVTPAQAAAMELGSLVGWDVPGANPEAYDAQGKFKR